MCKKYQIEPSDQTELIPTGSDNHGFEYNKRAVRLKNHDDVLQFEDKLYKEADQARQHFIY